MTSEVIRIRKGLDIKLVGEARKEFFKTTPALFACKPVDFHGVLPRLLVGEGDRVMAGTPVFLDKAREQIRFTSPVSGTVKEIRRGEKRLLLEIIVEADNDFVYVDFGKAGPDDLSREEVVDKMITAGVWPVIRQRPFSVIADPKHDPRAIVIPAFDTAPLAPDFNFIVEGQDTEFQAGIQALRKLTSGVIHLNIREGNKVSKVFTDATGVQVNRFSGPHPAGNAGTQISRLAPINKGDVIWYLRPQEVIIIGRLFLTGRYDTRRIIALTGPMVKKPAYFHSYSGAQIPEFPPGSLGAGTPRFISGNVLTGRKIERQGFTGFYDSQLTVIPEGNYHEFFGWAAPGFNKFSFYNMFLSKLIPQSRYKLDTNLHGSERAFVVTGKYEQVFPFDIYPMQLLKAILAEDIDLMENLGIYEVDEEDFALIEFIDTSKIEIQSLVRRGLDLVRKETT